MKTPFVAVALIAASFHTACGTAEASTTARAFDPMSAYADAKKLSQPFTANVAAVSLSATRNAQASMTSSAPASFTWIWTMVGEDGVFVDVAVSPAGAHVLGHERRAMSRSQATFDPSKVSVTGADVLTIASFHQSGQPTDLFLGANLIESGASALRWSVGFASGEVAIDGDTGDLVN